MITFNTMVRVVDGSLFHSAFLGSIVAGNPTRPSSPMVMAQTTWLYTKGKNVDAVNMKNLECAISSESTGVRDLNGDGILGCNRLYIGLT
mmetsp:Transcript_24696/g.69147  ORF Transcript_24696/g.69147 Transcript_24696/m.69147 type:complete len:90 (-) Transcript_24696:491-760(-)